MKRYIKFFIGLSILACGVGMLIGIGYGTSIWDAFFVGFAETFDISIRSSIYFWGSLLLIISSIIQKKWVSPISLLIVLFFGFLINFFVLTFFSQLDQLPTIYRVVLVIVATEIQVLGIALYLATNVAASHVEGFTLAIAHRFNMTFTKAKIITDIVAVVGALVFKGPISIVSLFVIVITGIQVNYLISKLEKTSWYEQERR
ncbi:MAG: YczE/YyaS/YitT family protein [Mycoplasmatales bacterium]